jgi:hypothetical protein
MEAHPQAGHIQNLCVSGKNVGGACQGVVPVMAERAGMLKWSSGSVFDLTVNGTQARTRGTRDQRNDPGPRGRVRGCAIS